ncbi:MAG: 30S ribosome-binding factor RbfA [Actinomycetota bacterium]
MSQRMERIQKLARQVLGELIHDLKDPRIGFTTVTGVRITPDLRHGKVWVSVLGSEEEQQETMAGLKSATPHLRTQLGRSMRIKYTPELVFEQDTGPQEAQRMEALINRLHDVEAATHTEPEDGDHDEV